MRYLTLLSALLVGVIPAPVFAGNHCYRSFSGFSTYSQPVQVVQQAPIVYSAPTYSPPVVYSQPAPKVEVKNYVPQTAYQQKAYTDEELAGELGRRISKYEAGLRALQNAASTYSKPTPYQSQSTYQPQQSIQPQSAANVPYQGGGTAYALQSQAVDVFGPDAVDKVAKLMEGQQRASGKLADNAQQIAQAVGDQIDKINDGIKAQQQANDAAREVVAQTDAINAMMQGVVALANATKPTPRASVRTNSYVPNAVPGGAVVAPQAAIAPQAANAPAAETLPTPQPLSVQATTQSVMAIACAKCHTGQNPSGGIRLDGTVKLSADQFGKVMRTIAEGKTPAGSVMPPMSSGINLTQAQRTKLMAEACGLMGG